MKVKESAQATRVLDVDDVAVWHAFVTVEKWSQDATEWAQRRFERMGVLPGSVIESPSGLAVPATIGLLIPAEEVVEREYNVLCNNGISRLEDLLIGVGSIVGYTNSVARLGVGNGVGTAAAADTDMSASSGSTNRWFQVMDATYPSRASQTVTLKSSVATGDGNFAWNEWGIDGNGAAGSTAVVGVNDATHGALLNHKTSAGLGTKATGTWALTATLVIS